MQMLNREIKNKIAQFKSNKWHETLTKAKTNDNSIWKLAKTFSKRRQTIPPLIANDTEAITDEQKAEALTEPFPQRAQNRRHERDARANQHQKRSKQTNTYDKRERRTLFRHLLNKPQRVVRNHQKTTK
jgi:hypothetical protein